MGRGGLTTIESHDSHDLAVDREHNSGDLNSHFPSV